MYSDTLLGYHFPKPSRYLCEARIPNLVFFQLLFSSMDKQDNRTSLITHFKDRHSANAASFFGLLAQ